ncbi:MAG: hypothetical protein ACD_8C00092G0007 [uncultured bacterium]|nr:MAG: hypothetical protein ACD_8C00092G0007 [uncultured bacterium]
MQKKQVQILSILGLILISASFLFVSNKANAAAPLKFTSISDQTIPAGSGIGMLILTNNPSTISLVSAPLGVSFDSANNNLNWAPTLQNIGANVITFSATNGVETITQSIIMTVTDPTPTPTPTPVPTPTPTPAPEQNKKSKRYQNFRKENTRSHETKSRPTQKRSISEKYSSHD